MACRVCRGPVVRRPGPGRPPDYCGVRCRRAVERAMKAARREVTGGGHVRRRVCGSTHLDVGDLSEFAFDPGDLVPVDFAEEFKFDG